MRKGTGVFVYCILDVIWKYMKYGRLDSVLLPWPVTVRSFVIYILIYRKSGKQRSFASIRATKNSFLSSRGVYGYS